jgi:hypothetical protein
MFRGGVRGRAPCVLVENNPKMPIAGQFKAAGQEFSHSKLQMRSVRRYGPNADVPQGIPDNQTPGTARSTRGSLRQEF